MGKSVLIICEMGITASSLLYKFAQEIEREKLDLDVDYAPFPKLEEKMVKKEYDVLLLTPQIRRYADEAQKLLDKYAGQAEIMMISDRDFQYMDVPHIVHQVEGKI